MRFKPPEVLSTGVIVLSPELESVSGRGEQLYQSTLRAKLEPLHRGEYVAIEPDSGEYFLGATASEAIEAARRAFPERLSYTCRVGYHFAVEIGAV